MHKQGPAEHHVEPAMDGWIEIVDRAGAPVHLGPERSARDVEAAAPPGSPRASGVGFVARLPGPVQLVDVVHVDRGDLRGAAALHLEGPEAIAGADVETPTAGQARRPLQ